MNPLKSNACGGHGGVGPTVDAEAWRVLLSLALFLGSQNFMMREKTSVERERERVLDGGRGRQAASVARCDR